jgi:transcriptional regulator with XRE-family HTH domain
VAKPLKSLESDRLSIGRRLRELREGRLITQSDLADQLDIPQGRLSEIERGKRSLSAEQFLAILRLFNVPATEFSATPNAEGATIQNTIARLGASHLLEDASVVPTATSLPDVIRETLAYGSPRLLTGLAPVLVNSIDQVNLRYLHAKLAEAGLERRFGWLVENTLDGVRAELGSTPPRAWTKQYRRAETLLTPFLDFLSSAPPRQDDAIFDVLDRDIRSPQTLDAVIQDASRASRRWRVWTRLQPEDFARALAEARGR